MSKDFLKSKWEALTPGAKKITMAVGLATGMVAFCFVVVVATGGNKPTHRERAAATRIENALLPNGDAAKQMGLSSLPREVDTLRRESGRTNEDVAKLRQQLESQQQGESGAAQAQEATRALQGDVKELRDIVEAVVKAQADQAEAAQRAAAQGSANPALGAGQFGPGGAMAAQMPTPQAYGGIRTISGPSGPSSAAPAPLAPMPVSAPQSQNGSVNAPPKSAPGAKDTSLEAETYTPSGSMIQGVLLTGLDAPTGQGAMKEPTPVLIRVKKESILPNRYLADFRECMIIAAGHGDLATERAILRAENLSCIRTDRSVIDVKLQGWVVGNDGKAGVRGRLVSKQGAVLARASLAGLADGIAQAFSGTTRGMMPGEDVDSAYIMQSGAFGGASTAMDRIAKYYLDLADQMHPVVEIDAGREVTLVLVRGISLPALRARRSETRG